MGRQRHLRAVRRQINQAVREGVVTPLGAESAQRVAKGRLRLLSPEEAAQADRDEDQLRIHMSHAIVTGFQSATCTLTKAEDAKKYYVGMQYRWPPVGVPLDLERGCVVTNVNCETGTVTLLSLPPARG